MNLWESVDLATADGHDRYVPSDNEDLLSAGHRGVYEWAVQQLVRPGHAFLDLGCGTGYGSAVVSGAGARYDGADSSPVAIDYARANFARPDVRFFVADLMQAPPPELEPGSYDVVFSSEVLEHVDDPFAFVRLMAGFLQEGGAAFVGTPNRLWSRDNMPGGGLLARSHVMEFTPSALEALLHTAFEEVSLVFRMFPDDAIRSQVLPAHRATLVRAATAFVREVAPNAVKQVRDRVATRQHGQTWSAADILWLDADDPRLDAARCVGLAAVCRIPRRPGR